MNAQHSNTEIRPSTTSRDRALLRPRCQRPDPLTVALRNRYASPIHPHGPLLRERAYTLLSSWPLPPCTAQFELTTYGSQLSMLKQQLWEEPRSFHVPCTQVSSPILDAPHSHRINARASWLLCFAGLRPPEVHLVSLRKSLNWRCRYQAHRILPEQLFGIHKPQADGQSPWMNAPAFVDTATATTTTRSPRGRSFTSPDIVCS